MTIRELFGEEIDEIVKKEPNTVKPSQDEITQMVKTALRTLAQ
jgi:fructose-1-phosphate kinase PfkB-like protein